MRAPVHCPTCLHLAAAVFIFFQNRLTESLTLFRATIGSPLFTKISLLLFLNKQDLFVAKIKKGMSIKSAFLDYDGNVVMFSS